MKIKEWEKAYSLKKKEKVEAENVVKKLK